jgi:hypothetical protein
MKMEQARFGIHIEFLTCQVEVPYRFQYLIFYISSDEFWIDYIHWHAIKKRCVERDGN